MKLWGLVIGASALVWLGCSKEAPSASPSAGPAGVVVELSGSVEATRDGAEPRALAVDAEVFADDTIKTGAGSSVAIKLSHNNAALRLEGDMSKRVDQSLAWKAPRREDDSVLDRDVDDQTAAAGRHTEREAAGTATTAVANADVPADTAAKSEAPREIAPAPQPTPQPKPAPPPAPRAEKAKKRSAPPPPPKTRRRTERKSSTTGGSGPSPKADVRRAPAAESAPGGPTRGGPVDVERLMRSRIKVCHALAEGEVAGSITAVVKVSADGSLQIVSIEGSSALAAVTSCARSKIAKLAVAGAKPGTYRVTVSLK